MISRILVPLDGSELAATALEPARIMARKQAGEIILLTVPTYGHVLAPSATGYSLLPPAQNLDLLSQDAEIYLEGIYQQINEGNFPVGYMLSRGIRAWEKTEIDNWLEKRMRGEWS